MPYYPLHERVAELHQPFRRKSHLAEAWEIQPNRVDDLLDSAKRPFLSTLLHIAPLAHVLPLALFNSLSGRIIQGYEQDLPTYLRTTLLRVRKGLEITQLHITKVAGLDRATVQACEEGNPSLVVRSLEKYCSAIHLRPLYLIPRDVASKDNLVERIE